MAMAHAGELGGSETANEEFEQLFDNCCLLYMKRFEHQQISRKIVTEFFAIAFKYGFKELAFRRLKELSLPKTSPPLGNVLRIKGLYGLRRDFCPSFALKEIDDLECSVSYGKWLEEFMSPFFREKDRDSTYREVRQHDFKQRITQIREAVLNEDWPKVGAFLGHLPSFRQNLKGVHGLFRKQLGNSLDRTCRMMIPYAPTIFRTGMERFMQYSIPRDVITKSAAELMLVLITAERKASNVIFDVDNNSLLYVTELLIHAIANGQNQEANDVISATSLLPSVAQKRKYGAVLRAYKALFHYEQWRLKQENNLSDLSNEIIAALMDVQSGQETVFIYASVHYLNSVGKVEELMKALVDCCSKTPYMIVDCYRALLANNLPDKASQLLDAVLPQCNNVSHPILLDWLEPRLLNPHNYDLPEEMLQHVCRQLFLFLDYGANKSNDRAWVFLWAAVQHLQDESLLRSQWESRKSWWPKFHRAELSDAGNSCRARIFARLQIIPV